MERRSYSIDVVINGRRINEVVIDPHYEEKHFDSINDTTVIALVARLAGKVFLPEAESDGFEYFRSDLTLNGKLYRLIWILEKNRVYIGVVNAFRRS